MWHGEENVEEAESIKGIKEYEQEVVLSGEGSRAEHRNRTM
jgi:hypothetical protein